MVGKLLNDLEIILCLMIFLFWKVVFDKERIISWVCFEFLIVFNNICVFKLRNRSIMVENV